MIDCSLAKNYLKERNRMTNDCKMGCFICPLEKENNGFNIECGDLEKTYTDEAIEIVQRWSNEHSENQQMKRVNKIVETKIKTGIEFSGAILLSAEETERLLTLEERDYYCWWWLRLPGHDSNCAAYVSSYGSVSYYGNHVSYDCGCVRPALKIVNFKSSDFEIGDKFEINGWKFKIISETFAWMYEQDIGQVSFRENCALEDANVYEKSDVKKYIDDWYKELMRGDKND